MQPREEAVRQRVVLFVLMRVTGLLLAVLVLGHFTLTHILHDVTDTDAAFIARRWSSAVWIAWDWTMLTAAVTHGAAGLWIANDDYTPPGAIRQRRRRILLAVSAIALALGTITIIAAET